MLIFPRNISLSHSYGLRTIQTNSPHIITYSPTFHLKSQLPAIHHFINHYIYKTPNNRNHVERSSTNNASQQHTEAVFHKEIFLNTTLKRSNILVLKPHHNFMPKSLNSLVRIELKIDFVAAKKKTIYPCKLILPSKYLEHQHPRQLLSSSLHIRIKYNIHYPDFLFHPTLIWSAEKGFLFRYCRLTIHLRLYPSIQGETLKI